MEAGSTPAPPTTFLLDSLSTLCYAALVKLPDPIIVYARDREGENLHMMHCPDGCYPPEPMGRGVAALCGYSATSEGGFWGELTTIPDDPVCADCQRVFRFDTKYGTPRAPSADWVKFRDAITDDEIAAFVKVHDFLEELKG